MDPQKDWEALWKRFSEVVTFMYDNEGVIESLKTEMNRTEMKKTIKGQMDEVFHLVIHHQEELSSLVDKAHQLAIAKGLNVGKTCESLKLAIQKLDLDQMKKNIEALKKQLK